VGTGAFPSPERAPARSSLHREKTGLLIYKHDHFTPTREIERHIRALARNHPEGWKLQGHVSPTKRETARESTRASERERHSVSRLAPTPSHVSHDPLTGVEFRTTSTVGFWAMVKLCRGQDNQLHLKIAHHVYAIGFPEQTGRAFRFPRQGRSGIFIHTRSR